MRRIRISGRDREAINNPGEAAILAEHDIGIWVVGEERRQCRYAIAEVAAHQQPALRRDVIAEGELGEVAAVERDEEPPEKPAEHDPAGALVGCEAVAFTLRVVELLLARLHVDVGIGQLSEIDFRPRHLDRGIGALHRHVAQDERGHPFRREAVDRVHRDAIAVRVNQLLVDPVTAALRELLDVQLPRAKHYFANLAVDFIAINVDVGKVVISADFLDLAERVLQCPPVPEPDVLKRSLIVRRISRLDSRLRRKLALHDLVQSIGLACQLDVVGNVGLLANQLVRLHNKATDVPAAYLQDQITNRSRKDRQNKPAHTSRGHGVDG